MAAATSTRRTTSRRDGAVARRRRCGGSGGGGCACSCVRVRVRVCVCACARAIDPAGKKGEGVTTPRRPVYARVTRIQCARRTPFVSSSSAPRAFGRPRSLSLARRDALSGFFSLFFFLHVHGLHPRPTAAIKKDAQPIPL